MVEVGIVYVAAFRDASSSCSRGMLRAVDEEYVADPLGLHPCVTIHRRSKRSKFMTKRILHHPDTGN